MDEKDSMTPDTIPQSTPVDGTVSAGRKNRRPVVIGVAAVAAVALVAGGVCGYRAYENRGCYDGRVEDGCDRREGREDP